jgi:hypothetical protein
MEHLQLSTAFSDSYQVFATKGAHKLTLAFTEAQEVTNVKKSGLGLFTYCAGSFEILTSSFMSSLLWLGGNGASEYLPIIGTKPTSYQLT